MRISIRHKQSSVKHQSDRPTCVSFAVTSLHEYARDVIKGTKDSAQIDLSEEYLHYHCKVCDGLPLECRGTTVGAAADSLTVSGQSLESTCPYEPRRDTHTGVKPSAAAMADGRTRLFPGLTIFPKKLRSVEQSLIRGYPVVAVMNWYSNAYNAPLGSIEIPEASDRLLGRHAILIVALDDESVTGRYDIVFKNSWGSKWGDNGFGHFRSDYFSAYSIELWGVTARGTA